MDRTCCVAIRGAAGQGVATPGDVFAKIFARRGLHLNAYNAYQSIIRGGHTFLTIRAGIKEVTCFGDHIDLLIPLNQDSMDRHLGLMRPGSAVVYNGDTIKPGSHTNGTQLCPLPVNQLSKGSRSKVEQNTLALAASLKMMGVGFEPLVELLTEQFLRKGDKVVTENLDIARLGYDYASANFRPFPDPLPMSDTRYAVLSGNIALAMGGAAAGVKFYCAYPMSPSTGVLHWMAAHAREAGIMVRQVEDELGVINMAIGAAHAGARAMCATSGGGFALMTEALGAAAMMEVPVVCIDVQRAGPATGVPTKTEQGDLWQVLGAGQGDYPRLVVAPTNIVDCFKLVPKLFNLVDKFQCPGIILSDLLLSEGRSSADPAELDFKVPIDRGDVIGLNGDGPPVNGHFKRYLVTESGISPRALPGTPGFSHVVATDEHDEDGVLISDEFTDPHKRQAIHEKRMRKMDGVLPLLPSPELHGAAGAQVTLLGWGSTEGVIREAIQQLAEANVAANNLQIRWLVPLHAEAILSMLSKCRKVIVVENNYSGQFARYLRSETGFAADGHIRKYDGEPFMPHHLVDRVNAILAGSTKLYVPVHEIQV